MLALGLSLKVLCGSVLCPYRSRLNRGADVAVGSDGGWHQDHVVSFYEAHDLVSTVGNASLFVGFAVAAELLLLSFSQTQK